MRPLTALALLALPAFAPVAAAAAPARATPREFNAWPLLVERREPGRPGTLVQAFGPLFFQQEHAAGFRPFHVTATDPARGRTDTHVLFPVFSHRRDPDGERWSLLELARRQTGATQAGDAPQEREFDVFPFWFRRVSADPERTYAGLFPLQGTIRGKFWMEEVSWTLFPLQAEMKRHGATTTYFPWPLVRVTRGTRTGWALWPLYGTEHGPDGRETQVLWPLGFSRTRLPDPDAAPGTPPRTDEGFLPFYARSRGPGLLSEDVLWPFFGWTRTEAPLPVYAETRYLWPFLVQGEGPGRRLNRWAPFFSQSTFGDAAKTWVLWPLWREARWTDRGLQRERHQLLYLLYWRETQRRPGQPDVPAATLTHLWPFWSGWDNGAGHRQWQALSPLEPLLPGDPRVRRIWAPLFALARHDAPEPGRHRTSLLWDAVTWQVDKPAAHHEFHLGPLFGLVRTGDALRLTLGAGVIGLDRPAAGGWRLLWGDFARPAATVP